MIFGKICQIVRKRCQILKKGRKKAYFKEKCLLLGGFVQKNREKWQFLCAFCAHKMLILLNFAQKAYIATQKSIFVLKACLKAYFSVNIFCVGRVMTLFSSEPSSKSLTILICRVAINLSTRRHAAILSTTEARIPEDNQHQLKYWSWKEFALSECHIKANGESVPVSPSLR